MSNILKTFSEQLYAFANQLCSSFPEDSDFKIAKSGIETMKSVNPKLLLELYTQYVMKYKDFIYNKDESFFLEKDFVSEDLQKDQDSNSMRIMMTCRKYWKHMSPEAKNSVWLYFQVLCKLSDKYYGL